MWISQVFCHGSTELCVFSVDDFLVCGTRHATQKFIDRRSTKVALKVEGDFRPQTSVNYPSRTLKRNGDSIDVPMRTAHSTDILKM